LSSPSDPTLAIAAYLKAQASINEATGGRIFRPELPKSEEPSMPRGCVIVRPAGGTDLFANTRLPAKTPRVDIVCYGSTRLECENIARECSAALDELTHSTWEKVIVFWTRIVGQPASAIDPETNWPFALVSAQVMCATRTTS
jgi:hypothetical protein